MLGTWQPTRVLRSLTELADGERLEDTQAFGVCERLGRPRRIARDRSAETGRQSNTLGTLSVFAQTRKNYAGPRGVTPRAGVCRGRNAVATMLDSPGLQGEEMTTCV